jgi:hypothetical protein
MEHYVTLLDSAFLPQGLALHASMERHAGAYTLWVLCMDEAAEKAFDRLQLPNVRTMALADVESDELRAVKPGRSRGEYCWTLTPFTPEFVFRREPTSERVTYVDADTWLCRNPCELFAEFEASGKSVLITDHAYAPEYDQSATHGRFCVQFMTFVRGASEPVRSWWAERCVEWCFARMEDGRFGDQKYLDDWPTRFGTEVHVLQYQALAQAPWNSTRFPPGEAVFYHFHGLRLLRNGSVLLSGDYQLPPITRRIVYEPYLADLRHALERLKTVGIGAPVQLDRVASALRLRLAARRLRAWWRGLRAPRIVAL